MSLIDRLQKRRDKLQEQLDLWIVRGFRGGGRDASVDATSKETADKVSEVAGLNRAIADRMAKDKDA